MTMSNGKNVGYIRVSTLLQNTDRQLVDIELDKIFEDRISGKDAKRPQLDACLQYLREDDVLYVHSIDRLARNLADLLNLVKIINDKGVTLIFIKEQMTFVPNDNQNFHQKLTLQILGAVAEFERELLLERQREGIKIAQAKNKYKNCGRKEKLSQKEQNEVVDLISNGESVAVTARKYNVSRQTIYTILHRSNIKKQSKNNNEAA